MSRGRRGFWGVRRLGFEIAGQFGVIGRWNWMSRRTLKRLESAAEVVALRRVCYPC